MLNRKEKFKFEVLRSDYDAVEKIIDEYEDQGKIKVIDVLTVVRDRYWTTTITVFATEADFRDMYFELRKEWLLMW